MNKKAVIGRTLCGRKVWTLVLSFLFLLAGCADVPKTGPPLAPPAAEVASSALPAAKPVRMAAVMPFAANTFLNEAYLYAQAQLELMAEQEGFEYRLKTGANAAEIAGAVIEMADFSPNVLLLWPGTDAGDAQLADAVRRLQAGGTKIVLYGGEMDGISPAAVISGDDASVGRWTGEKLLDVFAGEIEAGIPVGFLHFCGGGGPTVEQRKKETDTVLASAKVNDIFIQLAPCFDTGWDAGAAAAAMTGWLAGSDRQEREILRVVVSQDDELLIGIKAAVDAWQEEHAEVLPIRMYCGVGGRREALELFYPTDVPAAEQNSSASEAGGGGDAPAELVTYHYSPSFICQALLLAQAAASDIQYNAEDISGQTFFIPTIEIDSATVNAFRAGREYAERYGE